MWYSFEQLGIRMKEKCLYYLLLILLFRLTGSEGVEEEKELANSSADVERVEGLLQAVQLR